MTALIRPALGDRLELPPGLAARPPQPGDLDALLALARADEAAAVGSSSMTRAEVAELLAPAHTTAQDDQRVVVDAAGALLAWGLVWDHNRTDHQDVDVYSSPALGSETVRRALLDWLVARLGQRARAAGYERIVADAGCYHDDVRYAATLRSRGFAYVRTFHRLRIDLQPHEPISVSTPPGVEIVRFEPSEDAGGWVADLGVLASHRGRGIARALLQSSFEAHRRVGRTWVGLMVDTENDTGAVGLYESVGMRQEQSIDVYQRVVLPDAAE